MIYLTDDSGTVKRLRNRNRAALRASARGGRGRAKRQLCSWAAGCVGPWPRPSRGPRRAAGRTVVDRGRGRMARPTALTPPAPVARAWSSIHTAGAPAADEEPGLALRRVRGMAGGAAWKVDGGRRPFRALARVQSAKAIICLGMASFTEFSLDETVAVLGRTPPTLNALLRGLPNTWVHCNEGKDTWSAFDIVGHLIFGERTDWMPRLRIILDHGDVRPFDPFDRFAQFKDSQDKSTGAARGRFRPSARRKSGCACRH